MDNHWEGSLKQHIARLVSPFTIQKAFSHAFVPGHVQENYALKLGFDEKQIKLGFYSADTSRFDQYFDEIGQKKLDQFLKWNKLTDYDDLLKADDKSIQRLLEDYLMYLKQHKMNW